MNISHNQGPITLLPPFPFLLRYFTLEDLFLLAGVTPEILNNGSSLETKDDDIAHFTCMSRGKPRPVVRWEREGVIIKDQDEGIAILSKRNDTTEESHLFIAVSGNGRRGKYICVASNEKGVVKQSFDIKRKWT